MAQRQPPLDPRLLTNVRSARRHVIRTVVLGLVEAVCVIATAWGVARVGSALVVEREWPQDNLTPLIVVAAALAVRSGAVWWTQRTGHLAATETISELRRRLVGARAASGPRARADASASAATLATAGLENLRPYLTGYVPQLALSATVTPLALLAILLWDPLSAGVALIALPLIPIFMILIGVMTEGASKRSLATMRTLWSETLDLVEGLPTLRALGRAKGSEKIVADLGQRHKKSSMTTLAFAFLSSFALELIATLGVALIAVSIGLRLVDGDMELENGIAVLVLAAEVYLPLRMVGQQFHASTDGLAALDAAFNIIETPAVRHGDRPAPNVAQAAISFEGLTVTGRDRSAPHNLVGQVRPGTITALRGPSGTGKSTAVAALLGLIEPNAGRVTLDADGERFPVNDLAPDTLWEQVSWLPQRPSIGPGTIADIVDAALPPEVSGEDAERLRNRAAQATGLIKHVIDTHGWSAEVGRGGTGLSLGQRQRVALTAALIAPKPLVILDEPTSHLDGASEAMVIDLLHTLKAAGSTVIVTAHRPTLVAAADHVIDVEAGPRPTAESEEPAA